MEELTQADKVLIYFMDQLGNVRQNSQICALILVGYAPKTLSNGFWAVVAGVLATSIATTSKKNPVLAQ